MEQRLTDLLFTQLKRQGIADAATWHALLSKNITWRSSNTQPPVTHQVYLQFAQLGYNDRIATAIAECLLQFGSDPALSNAGTPATFSFILSMANNRLSDKVAASLAIVMSTCPFLTKVDLTGNLFTEIGISKLRAAKDQLTRPIQLAYDPPVVMEPATATAEQQVQHSHSDSKKSTPRGGVPQHIRVPQQQPVVTAPVGGAASHTSSTSIDLAGLRRDRDKKFQEEGLKDSQDAVRKRDDLRTQVLKQKPTTTKSGSSNKDAKVSSNNAKEQVPPLQMSKVKASGGPSSKRSGNTPADSKRSGSAGAKSTPSSGPVTKKEEPKKASQQDKEGGAVKKLPSDEVAADTKKEQESKSKAAAEGDDEEESSESFDSESTTETEVPDLQDYLDLTMNVGVLDTVQNLMASEQPPQQIFDASLLQHVTILNVSQNNLKALGTLPASLIRLDASSNLLEKITGLEQCTMLSVANFRRNKIQTLSGLDRNMNLSHLFFGRNLIKYIDNLAHLWLLEMLEISNNRLATEGSIRPLSLNPILRHLILVGNPVATKLGKHYKPVMRNLCGALIALDNQRLIFSRATDQIAKQMDTTLASLISIPNAKATALSMPVGYATAGNVANAARQIANRELKLREKSEKQAKRIHIQRQEVITKLQQQNQSMIEAALVEKLSTSQQFQQEASAIGAGAEFYQASGEDEEARQPKFYNEGKKMMAPNMNDEEEDGDENADVEPLSDTQRPYSHGTQRPGSQGEKERQKPQVQQQTVPTPVQQKTPKINAPPVQSSATMDHDEWQTQREKSRSQQHRGASPVSNPQTDAIFLRNVVQGTPPPPSSEMYQSQQISPSRNPGATQQPYPLLASAMPQAHHHGSHQQLHQRNVNMGSSSGKHHPLPLDSPSFSSPAQHSHQSTGVTPQQRPNDTSLHNYSQQAQFTSPIEQDDHNRTDVSIMGQRSGGGQHQQQQHLFSPSPFSPEAHYVPQERGRGNMNTQQYQHSMYEKHTPYQHSNTTTTTAPSFATPQFQYDNFGSATTPGKFYASQMYDTAVDTVETVEWIQQLSDDCSATRVALKTLLTVLETPNSQIEQTRCMDVVKNSGMLDDTQIPEAVVLQFSFSPTELNDPDFIHFSSSTADGNAAMGLQYFRDRRVRILAAIHTLGETKTCMRYLVALVENDRKDLLKRYCEKVRSCLI